VKIGVAHARVENLLFSAPGDFALAHLDKGLSRLEVLLLNNGVILDDLEGTIVLVEHLAGISTECGRPR
jgi:hypothetical protein